MVGTQLNILGVVIGYIMPVWFIDDYTNDVVLTKERREKYEKQVFYLFLSVAVYAVILTIVALLAFRERPGVPIWSPKKNLVMSQDSN